MSYQDFPPALLILSPRLTTQGDPSASMDGINTIPVPDGSLVYCIANRIEYQLDKQDDTTPANGTTVLAPLTGPGRWKQLVPASPPPLSFESHTTGLFEVTSDTPLPFLVQNAGAPLGFDIPQQPAGTFVLITWSGTMRNNGAGDTPKIQLVVNGTPIDYVFGVECGGANPTGQPGGPWRVELDPNVAVNTVRFTVCTYGAGHTVGCDPGAVPPTWVAVTGVLSS